MAREARRGVEECGGERRWQQAITNRSVQAKVGSVGVLEGWRRVCGWPRCESGREWLLLALAVCGRGSRPLEHRSLFADRRCFLRASMLLPFAACLQSPRFDCGCSLLSQSFAML